MESFRTYFEATSPFYKTIDRSEFRDLAKIISLTFPPTEFKTDIYKSYSSIRYDIEVMGRVLILEAIYNEKSERLVIDVAFHWIESKPEDRWTGSNKTLSPNTMAFFKTLRKLAMLFKEEGFAVTYSADGKRERIYARYLNQAGMKSLQHQSGDNYWENNF